MSESFGGDESCQRLFVFYEWFVHYMGIGRGGQNVPGGFVGRLQTRERGDYTRFGVSC